MEPNNEIFLHCLDGLYYHHREYISNRLSASTFCHSHYILGSFRRKEIFSIVWDDSWFMKVSLKEKKVANLVELWRCACVLRAVHEWSHSISSRQAKSLIVTQIFWGLSRFLEQPPLTTVMSFVNGPFRKQLICYSLASLCEYFECIILWRLFPSYILAIRQCNTEFNLLDSAVHSTLVANDDVIPFNIALF